MSDAPAAPSTGKIVLIAALAPVLIALVFLAVFDHVNQPTPGPAQPGEGLRIAARNDLMVHLHALAQCAFVLLGAWLIPRGRRSRVWFLLVAAPVAAAAYAISWMSLLAG